MGRKCSNCGADQPATGDQCTQCGADMDQDLDRDDFDLLTAKPGTSVTVAHDDRDEQIQGYAGDDAVVRSHDDDRDVNTFSQGSWTIADQPMEDTHAE